MTNLTIDTALTLNSIALGLNFIALIIVVVQTRYTKESLDVARNSIELTKTSRQLEQLPRMHFIIHVTYFLEKWNDELKTVMKYLKENNFNEIIKISKTKTIRPNGLIYKNLFLKMPNWLSVIYESGAQYYYNSSSLYKYLYDKEKQKIVDANYIDRFQESSHSLEVLLKYIRDEVPQVFLNCPASLNINDFFEKTSANRTSQLVR